MKKLIFIMLALLGMTQATAQEYEYVPFVREGVKWVYFYNNWGDQYYPPDPDLQTGIVYLNLEFKGDTVIDGKTYKAMHKYFGEAINTESDTIPIYMREEDKVVYGIVPDRRMYDDCPIGNLCVDDIEYYIYNGMEFVMYDFQDPVAYWDSYYNEYCENSEDDFIRYQFLSMDTIAVGNHWVKRYINSLYGNRLFYIIEGIGIDAPDNGYTLFPFRPHGGPYNVGIAFSHVIENGEIIYKGLYFDSDQWNAIDEVVTDQRAPQYDDNYYNLMGQPMGTKLPTTPGIYIHHGKKVVIR